VKIASLILAFSSLIYPAKCPSCLEARIEDFTNFGICSQCRRFLYTKVSITYRGPLKIFAGSRYSPNLARVILAAKESNQMAARFYLAERLTQSLTMALEEISLSRNLEIKNVVIIPIPSRRSANRKRGFAHVELLVGQLIKMNLTLDFKILDCLRHTKKISDQSSLNFNERAMNMKGAFAIDQIKYFEIYPTQNSNSVVFIVDDLVTTGATVQAANLALSTLGARVDGVLASCATDGFTH